MQLIAESYEVIPTGEYPVRAQSVEMVDGQFGKQFQFKLEIAGGEYKGQSLSYWTPTKLTENNKLGLFIKACGIEFEEGDTVDLDDVIGQVANATIIVSLKKSDNTEFNKVESVRPLKKKKRTEPEPAAQPKSKDKDEEDIFADE